ncbi:AI-2E family transporter [Helicobacter sp. MIT 14-3879]|uniref:AI-2E family transporter n=1 Tax=Helicobacter sp. MIT 14-3879 TaxID=2040649 RepID=UPI000E1E2E66|nr:AI-2E family transporter [Helicobacter sp. MIT 14-3879]RDU60410.1 AI-2E family transporter [Helicobacter sp. MIT 14-3879]
MQIKIFFAIIFLLCCWAMTVLYYAYIFDIMIAFLLCVSSFWIKNYLQKFLRYNILSSLCAVFLMAALLFIPLGFVLYRAFLGLKNMDWSNLNLLFNKMKEQFHTLPFLKDHVLAQDFTNLLNDISLSKISGLVLKYTSTFGQGSLNFVIDGCFIVIFLFIFFCWGERFYAYIISLLPFNQEQITQVSHEVSGTLRIVFLSTLFNIVLQGSAFGIITYIFGFNGIILGIVYGICSLIPVIGGIIIWLPVSLILYFQDNLQAAIIVALYSTVFIGFVIDNIVKPWLIGIVNHKLLEKPLKISEFLIFFAILAGLGAFGFWGIIIGPAINAFFIALLRVYQKDFLFKE